MRVVISFLIIIVLALLSMGYYLFNLQSNNKTGYVINQTVFDNFKGKQDLEAKLTAIQQRHILELDSISLLIQNTKKKDQLVAYYQQRQEQFQLQERQLSQTYTADVWKRINSYVADYGKLKGYSMIFGATGDGSIMYASDAINITDDLSKYINERYSKN